MTNFLAAVALSLLILGHTQILAEQTTIDVLDQFTRLGSTTLSRTGAGLAISDLGSSGQDGAALDVLGTTDGQGAVSWSTVFSPVPTIAIGSVLRHSVTGVGSGNNTSASTQVEMEAIDTGNLELRAAFSSGNLIDIHIVDTNGDLQIVRAATIEVIGDGVTVLDTLEVTIIVPPFAFDTPEVVSGAGTGDVNRSLWLSDFHGTGDFIDGIGTALGQGTAMSFTE